MTDVVPFVDLPRQHRALAGPLADMFASHCASAAFIGGEAVAAFERDFATFCEAQACAGVANGTDAIMLALRALGVGAGDVVVVPAHTFIATAEAVVMLGATPRFTDVDPVTYNMSVATLAAVDPSGVKAVIPVHLYGQAAEIEEIVTFAAARGWMVVEDCAQAHGARYRGRAVGTFGALSAFSFYPGKNLGALGDAGAVLGRGEVLQRVRTFANHGRGAHTDHIESGINSRLDAIQAAALSVKLPHLSSWNAARAHVAAWYDERLSKIAGVVVPKVGPERTHVYHLYVVQVKERDRLRASLADAGIQTGLHYAGPLHLQPAYRHLGHGRGDFANAERIADHCVSLPMFPELSEAQVERVTRAIAAHLEAGG